MPTQLTNTKRYVTGVGGFAAKGTLPLARTLTGTFSSVGVVVTGTSSLFVDEIVQGDWLLSTTNNQLRRVRGVTNNTTLILEEAFTVNQTAQAVKTCRTLYFTIIVTVSGEAAVTINGSTYQPDEVISYNSSNSIMPWYYDATGSELTFDVSY